MKPRILILLLAAIAAFNFNLFSQCTWDIYDTTNSGLPDLYINDIAVDHNNHIWFTTSYGVVEFDGDTSWTIYNTNTTGNGLPDDYTVKVIADADSNIWISHTSGATRYDGTNWNTYNDTNSPLSGNYIVDICPDYQGNVWFSSTGTKSGGVNFFNNNTTWHTYNTGNTPNLVSDEISNIVIDINETIWFSSGAYQDSGITKFNGSSWITYSMADTIALNEIQYMETDIHGNIWLADYGSFGILKFDGTNWTLYNSQNCPLPNNYVNCIESDIFGNMWFGTYDGAVRFDGDTTWTIYTTSNGLPDNNVSQIAADKKGFVYFSTYMGVARLNTNAAIQTLVSHNGMTLDSSDVYIELYSSDITGSNGQDSLICTVDYSMQNEFIIEDIPPGNYYLKANKKSTSLLTDMINSYYLDNDTTYYWQNATVFSLTECDWQNFVIYMYRIPNLQTGPGTFSGNIGFWDGSKSVGEPVPGAEVYIEQEPNDEPAYYTETDTLGDFTITGIAEGSGYNIFIDLPGFPLIETYDSLEITLANATISNLDFYVDTSGIYVYDVSDVIRINENVQLNVFPNPVNEHMTINYTLTENANTIEIKLIDQNGQIIKSIQENAQTIGEYSYDISRESYDSGAYYLHFRIDNKTYLKKLIFIDK